MNIPIVWKNSGSYIFFKGITLTISDPATRRRGTCQNHTRRTLPYSICLQKLFATQFKLAVQPIACSRLSDNGEEKERKKNAKSWRGGKKEKGRKREALPPPLSPVSSRFIFTFVLSQFSGPDYLGAWNRLFSLYVIELSPCSTLE